VFQASVSVVLIVRDRSWEQDIPTLNSNDSENSSKNSHIFAWSPRAHLHVIINLLSETS
jgi:hypothetical protein